MCVAMICLLCPTGVLLTVGVMQSDQRAGKTGPLSESSMASVMLQHMCAAAQMAAC